MDTASYDWLIVTNSGQDISKFNKILNATSIRFDQNLIIAYPYYKNRSEKRLSGLCDTNFEYKTSRKEPKNKSKKLHCNDEKNGDCIIRNKIAKTEFEKSYYRSTERFKNLSNNHTYLSQGKVLPLFYSGFTNYNFSRYFLMTNISKFNLGFQFRKWQHTNEFSQSSRSPQIHVVQYFKVRINSTLSMSGVDIPYPVEARNFLGEELIFGRCNSTDGTPSLDDDGPTSPTALDDVLHFFMVRLNATGLLGALMENNVDVALEPVTAHSTRRQDMEFIFPIAETMCNIYIRQQETSTVRDIFLAPFSARLIACVVAVAIAAALAVVIISKLATNNKELRDIGYTEALLWSTGILCQQGGTWTPPNPAASILLLVCLLFGVVTYNAYAAFITSVLSVRVASVDTVSLSQARGRCAVREVPVHSTRAHLAFPLPRNSPYARPTLISLLQLRGAGSLARLEASLVPEMPHCAPPPGFASARATDVRSALLLLVTGYIAAFVLGLVEYCWKNRKELRAFTAKCYSRCWNVLKQI
ncbi:Glutamate receptor delta-2 subunit [Operophtera brumata]|uniref:Glutamate receptor delta-2 subunit n=1 Tax=Operophtera brumata TaxID=104452 RepID=A0A0L7L1P0_OPEBR|nr:Glutamate receptor delta-2 subunit [Operophtera brumata]